MIAGGTTMIPNGLFPNRTDAVLRALPREARQ
jgi:hypothetical protein